MRRLVVAITLTASGLCAAAAPEPLRLPASTHNLLLDAKVSGNLASYKLGIRGAANHMIYDVQRRSFLVESQHHEWGVGFGKQLGVVPEQKPATWQAEWPKAVRANLIVLSGVYPNQPQPKTGWKIELRRDGKWMAHARGVGGWYNTGRYVWGGAKAAPITFDAIRVSVFSKDGETPIKSIHFRGEEGVSWIVAELAPIDARIRLPAGAIRAGRPARFGAEALAGQIKRWRWDFGDGGTAEGASVRHTFEGTGEQEIKLTFTDGKHTAGVRTSVTVGPPVEARVTPLTGPVMVGKAVELAGGTSVGKVTSWKWDFGDGKVGEGARVLHTFAKAGVHHVKLTVSDGRYEDDGSAIVRAHTAATLHVPQVVLDTDQKNEQDDQHYFGYGLFSELDVLGVNSIHHGGGQEPVNYRELVNVLGLAKRSGLPDGRAPRIFRGANRRLDVPPSGKWSQTRPIVTAASEAILAAARGASPTHPVWVVPVGPGTNTAAAILRARAEQFELAGRLRVMWLGGSNTAVTGEFNGNNDPWSMYVVAASGIETWIMPAPVGARVRIDKRTEAELYANNPLGQYLRRITPARNKPLFDPSCLSAIISLRLDLGWIKETEPVTVAGPDGGYKWKKADGPTTVRVIRQIDQAAMKADIFDTMKGKPRRLIGAPVN